MGGALSKDSLVAGALSLRFIPILFIFLPLSAILRVFQSLRRLWQRRVVGMEMRSLMSKHLEDVKSVQRQVKEKKKDLCSARRPLFMTTMRHGTYKTHRNTVDLSALNRILELDEGSKTLRVEPMVSMGELTRFLIERGWTLPVVPELDDLTVGGLVSGYGIESSSHKYGLFADTVEELELVVASGELVVCRREGEHADLFAAVGWSLGALGFLTSVTLRIIRCAPFVRVRYHPLQTHEAIVAAFSKASEQPKENEFVEAIVFGPESGVLVTGTFCEKNDDSLPVNHLRSASAEWYYKQLERMPCHEELIPLEDWYHRHTSALFWEMELILPFGNSWLFRHLLGWMMPINISLLKMTHFPFVESYYEAFHTAQDFLVPINDLGAALHKAHEVFEIYPLWLCPHLVTDSPVGGSVRSRTPGANEMFVDVGVYGVSQRIHRKEPWNARLAVSQYEQWLLTVRGYSALYANVELSRDDFSRMFDRELHERMRIKWAAKGVFRDTYDKVGRGVE